MLINLTKLLIYVLEKQLRLWRTVSYPTTSFMVRLDLIDLPVLSARPFTSISLPYMNQRLEGNDIRNELINKKALNFVRVIIDPP